MLVYHFFCVAFYSIWILFTKGLPPKSGVEQKKPGLGDVPGLTLLSFKVVRIAYGRLWRALTAGLDCVSCVVTGDLDGVQIIVGHARGGMF